MSISVHYDLGNAVSVAARHHQVFPLQPAAELAGPLTLIMPRTVPGGYAQRPYDPFVLNVYGPWHRRHCASDVHREENAPRWIIGTPGERHRPHRVRRRCEAHGARNPFRFGQFEDSRRLCRTARLLDLCVHRWPRKRSDPPGNRFRAAPWPVFSTLAPQVPAPIGKLTAQAADYYALADSQIMMGHKLQLEQFPTAAACPLFLAAYAEGDADLAAGRRAGARRAGQSDRLFRQGAVRALHRRAGIAEAALRPPRIQLQHGASGERHILFVRGSRAHRAQRRPPSAKRAASTTRTTSLIHGFPKRAYGENYLPFRWEMTPLIDTIWFNEGFGRYVAIEALAEALPGDEAARYRKQRLDRLQAIVDSAPPFLRQMSLDGTLPRRLVSLFRRFSHRHESLFARRADGCGNGRRDSRANEQPEIAARRAAPPDRLDRAKPPRLSR